MPVIWVSLLLLVLHLCQPAAGRSAEVKGGLLEELHYRVDLGVLGEVAQVHLRLRQAGPGRYRAEFSGAAQGVWSLLSRWLPERYETEMELEGGRLRPAVYREEFQSKGRRVRKEYRFDYSQGVLELWRSQDGRQPEKRWQVPLKKPVYDPLTLFYNLRLGALGPLAPGETLRVALVPSPEPRQMVFHIGLETAEGLKVMVEVIGQGSESAKEGPYFLFFTPQRAPRLAWTRVPFFGKLSGELLNPEVLVKTGLPGLPGAPAN
jgi:hypothetical protein